MKIQCPRINRLGKPCSEYVWNPTENKLLCHRCLKTDSGKLYQEKLRLEKYYEKVVLGGGKAKTPAPLPTMEPKPKPKEADLEVEEEEDLDDDLDDLEEEVDVPEEVKEDVMKPSIALETKYRHAIENAIAQGEADYLESLKPKASKAKASKPAKVEKAKPAKKEKKIVEVPSDDEVEGEADSEVDFEEDGEADDGEDPLADLDSNAMDEKVQRYTKHAIRLTGITVEQFLRNKYGVDLPGFANTLAEEPEMQEAVNEMVKEYGTADISEFVEAIPPWAKLAIVGGSVAAHCYSKGKGSCITFPLPSQIVSDDNNTEIRGDKLLAAITPDVPTVDNSLLEPVTPQD